MKTRTRVVLAASAGMFLITAADAHTQAVRPPDVPSCLTGEQECMPEAIRVARPDLGSFGGSSTAYGINAAGQVVGVAHAPFQEDAQAFFWTRSTGMRRLGGGLASDINNRGQVTGYLRFEAGVHAFIWNAETGRYRDLGTLGGNFSYGRSINDRGWVVGNSETVAGTTRAFLWTPEAGMVDLGTLGGTHSTAYGINLRGQVVGGSMTADLRSHAFTWSRETGMVDLGLGVAFAVNRHAWIVGQQYLPDWSAQAVAWTPSGLLPLGLGAAVAINELGDIAWNNWLATLWSWSLGVVNMQSGSAQDLNELAVMAGAAAQVNDDTGVFRAALWLPETGWAAEFSAVRRLIEVIEPEAREHLSNGTVNALARAERAVQAGDRDTAIAKLQHVLKQVRRLTRNGQSPEWYVLGGTLSNILQRIEAPGN
jgi:probable HAF family extracellular repeat protein